jgi:hypothetical membrane protein
VTDRLGPLVRRSVHVGALLLAAAAAQFVLAMAVVQSQYPGYSLTANYISDLGNTGTSKLWYLFSASIIAFGLLTLLGVWLIRSAFREKRSRTVGLGLLMVAAVGAILVGCFPENVHHGIHELAASVTFIASGLALTVLTFAMLRDTRWDRLRLYTLVSGLVTLAAVVVIESGNYGPLGVGGIERIVVAPVILWSIVAGIHLARIPTYAPTGAAAL